ncbi:hypothetical protein [Agarilytica rhodophyticola]|uniref:hypothetical protein n=1 Tax=Agarilytica rhodophyticola TaxID=1737490 RepID=UPI000B342688|nr:hypothetical protein [Agarilytica rhodophyticola]
MSAFVIVGRFFDFLNELFGGSEVINVNDNRPRGIRNNNPGNLVLTAIPWRGKIPPSRNTDGRFEQFENPIYGIRALFMDLRNDVRKGTNTIEKLINEFAPSHENNTGAYIMAVANAVGKSSDVPIDEDDYVPLINAIIRHENGVNPFTDEDIKEAIALA